MLAKAICKACIEDGFRKGHNSRGWEPPDDGEWERGRVFCGYVGYCFVTRDPPPDCPFAAEHVVSQWQSHSEAGGASSGRCAASV